MKAEKTGKKKDRNDRDDLAEMREAFRTHKEREKGGGGGANDWDKLSDGKNMRRILPWPSGDRKFYTEGYTHFNVGPNNKAIRCIDEKKISKRGLPESGTKCPLCKKFLREQSRINSEYEKGDEDGRAEWKRAKDKYVPRRQYYVNVLRESDDGEDFEVKIYPFGPQVWGQLMNFYLTDDSDIGDFTDPESGRWLNIKKDKKGGNNRRNVEYKVYPASDSEDISEAWDDIKEQLHDLDAAAGKLLSKEEVIAIMKGVDPDKGDDDDDDDDDADDDDADDAGSGDDDEDDRPNRKKSKLAKKMKRRSDDDDDDGDEEEDDED